MVHKITIFLVVAMAAVVLCVDPLPVEEVAGGECGVNEAYSECGSSCGEPKCRPQKDIICLAVCERGCFCAYGTARNDAGACVPFRKCRKV